jgi:5-dehydro-2-deoxygluconokinase
LLGLEASESQLWASFQVGARQRLCRGFAVGRTLFASAAKAWFAGEIDDSDVVADVATRYQRLIRIWQQAESAVDTLPQTNQPLPAQLPTS